MNKCKKIITISMLVLMIIGIAVFIIPFSNNETTFVKKHAGRIADVKNGKIESVIDTHGGFHGDGESFIQLLFTDSSCLNSIKENTEWKELPVTKELQKAIWGLDYTVADNDVSEGPLIVDTKINIPKINHGYYYFEDRGDSTTQKEKTENSIFAGAYSYNLTIALFDTDNNALYYYELDT